MIKGPEVNIDSVRRLSTTEPTWRAENWTTSSWFDNGGIGVATITGGANFSARGLTVEEHTSRVLVHLLGERDGAA